MYNHSFMNNQDSKLSKKKKSQLSYLVSHISYSTLVIITNKLSYPSISKQKKQKNAAHIFLLIRLFLLNITSRFLILLKRQARNMPFPFLLSFFCLSAIHIFYTNITHLFISISITRCVVFWVHNHKLYIYIYIYL